MKLLDEKKTFLNLKHARYSTDVMFQQSNKPSDNMQEEKVYFSSKRKLYGLNMKISVLPNVLAMSCSNSYLDFVSHISFMSERLDEELKRLQKSAAEMEILEIGMLSYFYSDQWCVRVDKGRQRASEFCEMGYPHRKPFIRALTVEEEDFSQKLSSDCVLLENYFGRLNLIWVIMSTKYMLNKKFYNSISRFL